MSTRNVSFARSLSRIIAGSVLGLVVLLSGCDANEQDEPVRLRVVHAAPGIGSIDVAVDFETLTRDLEARTASPYTLWDAGLQLVVVETVVDDLPVTLTREVFLQDGLTYTLVVTGTTGEASLLLIPDAVTATVPGEARIRAVHAAERSDFVNLFVAPAEDEENPVLDVLDLDFSQFTQDVAVDAGVYDIVVETTSGSNTIAVTQDIESQRRYLIVITNTGIGNALSVFVVAEG